MKSSTIRVPQYIFLTLFLASNALLFILCNVLYLMLKVAHASRHAELQSWMERALTLGQPDWIPSIPRLWSVYLMTSVFWLVWSIISMAARDFHWTGNKWAKAGPIAGLAILQSYMISTAAGLGGPLLLAFPGFSVAMFLVVTVTGDWWKPFKERSTEGKEATKSSRKAR